MGKRAKGSDLSHTLLPNGTVLHGERERGELQKRFFFDEGFFSRRNLTANKYNIFRKLIHFSVSTRFWSMQDSIKKRHTGKKSSKVRC